jgi:hypothetical protein
MIEDERAERLRQTDEQLRPIRAHLESISTFFSLNLNIYTYMELTLFEFRLTGDV